MEMLLLSLLITSIFIFVAKITKLKKQNKKYEDAQEHNYLGMTSEKENKIKRLDWEISSLEKEKQRTREQLEETFQSEKEMIRTQVEYAKQAILEKAENDKKVLMAQVQGERILALEQIKNEVEKTRQEELAKLKADHEKILSLMISEEEEVVNLLAPMKRELEEYRAKRSAINESIQRERSIEMEKDFHRITLSIEAKDDISYLLTIEPKIHNKEILRKLIYESYIRPSLLEMQKRVLGNDDPTGIYKITDSVGRIYIGKSTKVKTRWQSHCKEALGIGGISHQEIHNAFKVRGWDDFTFELLEQCDKDSLNAREKYYIDFYESAKLGYNMKAGG